MKKIKIALPFQILIGLGLGILLGIICMENAKIGGVVVPNLKFNNLEFLNTYIKPLGNIFLNLLKFIVVPVVFLSMLEGIISMSDIKKVMSLGVRTIIFYLVTTCIAIIIGLSVAEFFRNHFELLSMTGLTYTASEGKHFMNVIVDFFPSNILSPFVNANMIQIIVTSLFVGFGIIIVGKNAEPIKTLINSLNEIFVQIMELIIALSPLGVFCLISPVVAENGPKVIGSLAFVVFVAYLAYILHIFITYSVMVGGIGKVNPIKFFKTMVPAMIFAFSSASSVGTLPINLECANKIGARKEVASFVLPLGATINMDGTAIYQGVCTVFIAACFGINLNFHQIVTIVITATIASIGTAGVPGAGVVMLAMVLQSVGLPVEGIALVYGVDRIFDMGRTVVNITGDSACAACVSKITETPKRLLKNAKITAKSKKVPAKRAKRK